MKRRWKKFLAGVLSAALALNLAAPLALADSVKCTVAGVELSGDQNSVPNGSAIDGQVSYLNNTLTFISNEVTLSTLNKTGVALVTAADGNDGLRLVANGRVIGHTKGNGFEFPIEIAGGEYYYLTNFNWQYSSTGILGATNDKTKIASDTRITLDGFKTGIGGGDVQIDGKVTIKTTTYSGSPVECGIANSTTMNPGSELLIYAQQYIGEQGHLTYNGGHLLLNVTTIGMDFGLSRLGIGENVSRFWYRTDDDAGYTEIDTSVQEKLDSFFEVKETNHAYLELTDVDPDQQESETYDLWVAGTQVKKTNQKDVLDDGTVAYDPNTHTLTLKQADLTLSGDAEEGIYCCIQSELADMLTITGTATLSNADGILTEGPLTLDNATLTLTGNINEDVGDDAIRAGRSDEDITIENSTVTIAGTNSKGNFFQFGIRCGKLTVANSTLDVKANSSAIVVADEMKVSGVNTIVMAETGASEEEDDYALKLDNENSLTMNDGLVLVEGEVNKSKKAKIARSEQAPTNYLAYWVVRPGDEAEPSMQIPGAITSSDFVGWFLEDGTRLEDSPYYMGPDADYVGNLDRDVTFYGHWRTAESDEGGGDGGDGGDGFGTLLAVGAVVGVAGVVAYQVGTELILDQLLPAGVAVPHTRAELAMLLWNTAGRPAPATLPAFADVADPELAQAAQWAIEQGYLKARADGSFKPDKGVAKWRVIRGYRAVTEP